jgi:hypothetical protein
VTWFATLSVASALRASSTEGPCSSHAGEIETARPYRDTDRETASINPRTAIVGKRRGRFSIRLLPSAGPSASTPMAITPASHASPYGLRLSVALDPSRGRAITQMEYYPDWAMSKAKIGRSAPRRRCAQATSSSFCAVRFA